GYMAYIETLAPRDWSFCTLFGYPYSEGVRNIRCAFPCCSPELNHEPPSLCERVTHFVVGIALLIPLINTIVFIVLRCFQSQVIIQDRVAIIARPERADERSGLIEGFNQQRKAIIKQFQDKTCKEPERTELLGQLRKIEEDAAQRIYHVDDDLVAQHQQMSMSKDAGMTKWDGAITYRLHEGATTEPSVLVEKSKITPYAKFTQVGGLTQLEAENYMCGYYALFFMLNAVTGQDVDHTNRDAFNEHLDEWQKIVAAKRLSTWLSTHRNAEIPYGLQKPTHSLDLGDMQCLINESDSLAPLRETPGCFMLEMDDYDSKYEGRQPIKLLGKSYTDNCYPTAFPVFITLKENNLHYYVFYARSAGKFSAVHSLNHDISNPENFPHETFTKILLALTGVKSPLQLKW
ncbi:hypothetical protein ACFLR2_02085, partial [Chlamydiota bacterium]